MAALCATSKPRSTWRDLETRVHVVPDARNPATFVDVFVVGPTVIGGRLKGGSDIKKNVSLTIGTDWYFENRDGSLNSTKGRPRRQRDPDTDQLSLGLYAWKDAYFVPRFLLPLWMVFYVCGEMFFGWIPCVARYLLWSVENEKWFVRNCSPTFTLRNSYELVKTRPANQGNHVPIE